MIRRKWISLMGVAMCLLVPVSSAAQQAEVAGADDAALLPVWETTVDAPRPLFWYGNRFDAPIELRLVGIELSINGQQVPLYDSPHSPDNSSLLSPPEERELSPHEALNRQADAEPSFDEFAQTYRTSELVDSMFVVSGSEVAVRWVDSRHPVFESLHYDPVPLVRPVLTELVLETVVSIADHLDGGHTVWCNGINEVWWTKSKVLPELPSWAVQYAQNPLPLTREDETKE